MIYINPNSIQIPAVKEREMTNLTAQLCKLPPAQRASFIERNSKKTWAHRDTLKALRAVVGNKCWYSEVHLDGADPNVDHFRPKGSVREVDEELQKTDQKSEGYWWLAFDPLNFRLASMHSNQRRTDEGTAGGKWDYFPIRGVRTPSGTPWRLIHEDALALDPCSATDVKLLFFDLDGKPCAASRAVPKDMARVKASIWLYHLDKIEIQNRRSDHVQDIRKDLAKADAYYKLWAPSSAIPDIQSKNSFDEKISEIKSKISDEAEFSRAKRCTIRIAITDYPWIEEYDVI